MERNIHQLRKRVCRLSRWLRRAEERAARGCLQGIDWHRRRDVLEALLELAAWDLVLASPKPHLLLN
jgi:hypothetical protein